jgi:membrane associated rhomboid family serine protease
MAVCYRHTNRETGVSCSSCGRPICPDCMTPTPVGMRCPECSRERTKVKTVRAASTVPIVTQVLIAVNVAVFIAELASGSQVGTGTGGTLLEKGGLFGQAIADSHQYYRIVTAGFLHESIFHIFTNMISLYFIGPSLEPAIGRLNFGLVYASALLAGSFGALVFTPEFNTVGASGAIFGVFGALIVVARARGISIWQSGLGFVLLLNLVLSVSIRGISIGGHIGGLIAGLISGWLIVEFAERRGQPWVARAGMVAIGVIGVAGAIAVAGGHGIAPNGIGFAG